MAAPSPATIVLARPGHPEPLQLSVELYGSPLRVGITWRVDEAEPGTVVLSGVVEGSPAARAGLKAGDRVYQVDGRSFADEEEFAQRVNAPPDALKLLIERQGQMLEVVVHLVEKPLKRAA